VSAHTKELLSEHLKPSKHFIFAQCRADIDVFVGTISAYCVGPMSQPGLILGQCWRPISAQ